MSDCLHHALMGCVGHIDHHPHAVHFINGCTTEIGQSAVFRFPIPQTRQRLGTVAQIVMAIVGQRHPWRRTQERSESEGAVPSKPALGIQDIIVLVENEDDRFVRVFFRKQVGDQEVIFPIVLDPLLFSGVPEY